MALRRLFFPLWLARARLARRRERFALVVLGLGAAAAMLGAVLAGTVAAQDRDLGRKVASLPDSVQAVRVNWFSVGGQAAPYAMLDAHVRSELHRVVDERATGTSLYRESQLGGALLGLGAVDQLGRWVQLRSGRLPHRCEPERCEVLVIRHGGRIPNVPGLRLVPVGEGDLRTATLFGDAVPAATLGQSAFVQQITRYHRPAPPPLVLANGVAGLDRSPLLHDSYRSYGWVVPLERGSVRSWSAHAPGDPDRARPLGAPGTGLRVRAVGSGRRATRNSGRGDGLRPAAAPARRGGRGAPACLRGAGGGAAPPRRGSIVPTTPLERHTALAGRPSRRRRVGGDGTLRRARGLGRGLRGGGGSGRADR